MPSLFWFDPFVEARAEVKKWFHSFFGSKKDKKNCFPTLLTFCLFSASIWLMLKLLVYLSQGSFRGSCPTLRQWIRCNFHGGWMRGAAIGKTCKTPVLSIFYRRGSKTFNPNSRNIKAHKPTGLDLFCFFITLLSLTFCALNELLILRILHV